MLYARLKTPFDTHAFVQPLIKKDNSAGTEVSDLTPKPFLSIIMASYRPEKLRLFFDNLITTADDPASFEVLIKLDTEDQVTQELVSHYQKQAPFIIKYIVTPKYKGAYSMHTDYNHLLGMTDSNSYFCVNLTDEIRFKTQGWDTILKSHIKLFPDDIFRLEISNNKARNYYELNDCLYTPDNYPVITKKWLYLTGGWGDYWGTDSWQGLLNFHLGRGTNYTDQAEEFFRSIPLFNLQIAGDEAGQDEAPAATEKRMRMIHSSFAILKSRDSLENFLRLSQRLRAHIIANQKHLATYQVKEDFIRKKLTLISRNKTIFEFSFEHISKEKSDIKISLLNKLKNFILERRRVNKYQISERINIIPSNYTKILHQINALE